MARKILFDPEKFLAQMGKGTAVLSCRTGQVIFRQGEGADAIFYIQKGKIKLTDVSEQGKEAVVGILGAADFFGEGCLNGHPRRMATASAIEESVITRIEKAAMIATIHNEPTFSELFMAYLLARNSRIEEDLIDQLFNSSEKRLAQLLLLLANFGKEGKPEPIVGKISQETLAEMIGTTRARVSFFMNKFRKLGFIGYKVIEALNGDEALMVLQAPDLPIEFSFNVIEMPGPLTGCRIIAVVVAHPVLAGDSVTASGFRFRKHDPCIADQRERTLVMLRLDHDLQSPGACSLSEGVIGLQDLIEAEAMCDQFHRIDPIRLDSF